MDFESEFRIALEHSRYRTMDDRIANVKTNRLNPRTYTDSANYSYRLDGNNVDIETENVTLAANQLRYNGLIDSINKEFSNLKLVMK